MAKINGQLEGAQLENLSGNPANHPTGRVYMDITTPAAAVPKVYDGSNWRILAFAPNSIVVQQNSASAVTVDWSTGLVQQVTLTGHAVIGFTNPQEGQIHTLIVKQATFSPPVASFGYILNMTDQEVGNDNGPYQPKFIPSRGEKIHQWMYHLGAVNAYTTCPTNWLNNIGPAVSFSAVDIGFDGGNWWVAGATTTTPFSSTQKLNPQFAEMLDNPFAALYVASTAGAGAMLDGKYSPNGTYYSLVGGTSPFLQTWYVLNGSNTGGVLTNPASLPTGAAKCVEWHPRSNVVLVGTGTTPFINGYPLQNGVYGTILANPAVLPAGQVNGMQFTPFGDFLALVLNVSPFIHVMSFTINSITGVGSFGTKVNDPAVLPGGGSLGTNHHQIAWRPQCDFIAMCISVSPWVYLIPFNRATSSFGTPITFPALSGGASSTSVTWTPDGQYLIVGANTTPWCYVYDMSTGVPTITTLDFAAPSTGNTGLAMHPSGKWGVWTTSSQPHYNVFIPPNKQRNYVRIV